MKTRLFVTSWTNGAQFAPTFTSGFRVPGVNQDRMDAVRQLKDSVIGALAREYAGTLQAELVQRAVNEADALAATTGFPALFLPTLAEEKVASASRWQTKQRALRQD